MSLEEPFPGVTELVHLPVVDSTQAMAREMARADAPEGTLVWADRQRKGVGRMGAKWNSGRGGLYASLILRPGVLPSRLAELNLTTADAAARALSNLTGLKTCVKAPNDVLAAPAGEGQPDAEDFRKVCGILAEASGGQHRVDWVVLGFGINVNNKLPKSLPGASSVLALSGKEYEVEAVLRRLLEEFQTNYRAFLSATNGHHHEPHP